MTEDVKCNEGDEHYVNVRVGRAQQRKQSGSSNPAAVKRQLTSAQGGWVVRADRVEVPASNAEAV
jgi:hypothetical protein